MSKDRVRRFEDVTRALGQCLRDLRRQQNLSQQQLADQALLSRQQLAYIEDGDTNPTLKTLVRLADVLKVELAFLVAPKT